jgi:hypothetical protein
VVALTSRADTSPEAIDELMRTWRSLTCEKRWALLAALDADVETIARAGILWANPDYNEEEVHRELFRRRYGDQLTLDALGPSRSH